MIGVVGVKVMGQGTRLGIKKLRAERRNDNQLCI